ncbi:MAG: hypothetical protein K2H61_02795, partial [Muribaculaceae bacterium]|nr:hypothetical protein [Muribaculaceae bacterium]
KRIGNFFKLPIQLFSVISYPELALILRRSSVMQMCSRSEGAMRVHCDRNKRAQMHDDWPGQW